MIRQMAADAKLSAEVRLEALESAIPQGAVEEVVAVHGVQRQRERKLSAEMGLEGLILMNLFSGLSLGQVMVKLTSGVRDVWPGAELLPATAGAFSQLRYQLGAKVVVDLFHRICQPMASPETPGAYYDGLRLMAIDGSDQTLADTPDIEGQYGRHTSGRGEAAFPQGKAVYLVEVGSRAVVDAGIWPIHTSERVGALRMLRSVGCGMLVLWDAGLYSYAMVDKARRRGAHVLCRLPAGVQPQFFRRLWDGSQLVYLLERDDKGKLTGRKRLMRLIEYTITDPALPGYGEKHRLVTSLLNPWRYPALELARLYHERWEIEITIDETDTHLRTAYRPFRSRRPVGLIQEFFAMLIAHYALRKLILEAAELAQVDPDRISFTNALRLLQDTLPKFQTFDPLCHPALYHRLLRDIARFRLPERANRSNPRVVKRKMSNFDKKRPEHFHWPQPRGALADALALI